MRSKLCLSLTLSVLFAPAHAAEDLLDAYRAAMTNDPRFQVAYYEYEAAKQAVPQARAQLLPGITLDLRGVETDQTILDRDQTIFGVGDAKYRTYSFNFQASQPLFRLSAWVGLKQARASVRQAHALYAGAQQDLIQRTAQAYITVLAARDNLELAQAEQTAVGQQLELMQGRRRGGLANITDEYEAQARFSRVEADVITATYTLDESFQALREVVGDAVSEVIPFQQDIPMVEPDPPVVTVWVDRALAQNYSLIAANAAVEVASKEIRRRRANHYPTLDLVARHGNIDAGGSITGGATDVDSTEYGLQISLPIYQGGAISSQTYQAEMQHQGALEERKLTHRVVMRETRASFQTVRSAISRVRALQASLVSQQSALSGRRRGYEAGVSTLLDVLDAERDLYSTSRDYANARYEYLLNLLRLKAQTGTLTESDLAYINGFLARS